MTDAGRRELLDLSGIAGADEHFEHAIGMARVLWVSVCDQFHGRVLCGG